MEYGYKLRNGAGLYRLPGADGLFTKRGKVWNSFAALKSHLRMTAEGYGLAWEFADDDRLTGRFWQDGGADDNNPQ